MKWIQKNASNEIQSTISSETHTHTPMLCDRFMCRFIGEVYIKFKSYIHWIQSRLVFVHFANEESGKYFLHNGVSSESAARKWVAASSSSDRRTMHCAECIIIRGDCLCSKLSKYIVMSEREKNEHLLLRFVVEWIN